MGLIHHIHASTFKILAGRPSPTRGWQRPQPFLSAPGFLVETPSGPAVFVDSIDAAGDLHRIEDGPERVARLLWRLLEAWRVRLPGWRFLVSRRFRSAGGNAILEALQALPGLGTTSTALTIRADDLVRLRIPAFYCETATGVVTSGYLRAQSRVVLRDVPVLEIETPPEPLTTPS